MQYFSSSSSVKINFIYAAIILKYQNYDMTKAYCISINNC